MDDKPTKLMILRSKEIKERRQRSKDSSMRYYAKHGIDADGLIVQDAPS